jgi:transcriptional regulator with XRE-family HTH domain
MSQNSTYRRKRRTLAQQLKHLRELSEISGNQFAKTLGWAQSKVSRIETGVQLPSESDLSSWATALNVPKGEYGLLLQLLEQAEAEYHSWRANYKTAGGSKNKQLEIKYLEANSSKIREFQLCLVPGLLQTFDYAQAVLTAKFGPLRFGANDNDVNDTITVRMERQSILYDIRKSLSFVVAEACLRTRISPKDVQQAQIQRMIDLTLLPNVEIGVIPFDCSIPLIPINGFAIYDDEMVVIETLSGEQQLSTQEDVILYTEAFSACLDISVKGAEAAELMRQSRIHIIENIKS